jgi:3-hydroxyisobutyrate dehydrogenase-like beta-hydroxyacid dehydrogenase
MRQGMCKNLVEKGRLTQPLLLFNRTTSRASDLSSKIGRSNVASSIDDAVSRSDIIFICLGDDTAVETTLTKAIQGNVEGKLFVDCSTIHPDTTNKVARAVEEQGAHFVACPVFGAPAMADSGQLLCVLAGPAEQVDKVKPYCGGVMGRAIIDYSGSEPAKATLLKVIGNTFILSMVETISEGHVVAEKTGLGVDELHQFIEAMFPGPYTAYSNRMRSGDYCKRKEPLFSANLARKDAGHAMALAERAGAQMKIVQLADGYLKGVQDHMKETGDIAGIYGAKRVEAGLKFENSL